MEDLHHQSIVGEQKLPREREYLEVSKGVDVVIVAHNAGALLSAAVGSAVAQAGAHAIWVMDAESQDDSISQMQRLYPDVKVLNVPNRGFSASNNKGIEKTDSEYVLLLNPDAELKSNALDILLATAKKYPQAAIIGPAILTPGGKPQVDAFGDFPSVFVHCRLHMMHIMRALFPGWSKIWPRLPDRATSVDWVTGAAMLVRRAAIENAGLMDENFFLYYEDTEWCHRMRDHGWDIILEPMAQVIHHLGKSGAPSGFVAKAYRESFSRYCALYNLWGLRLIARVALFFRSALGWAR